jgi:DHA2 family multidrug resistance protein-like MFS transporter
VAGDARQTLTAAVAAGGHLPASSAALLDTARQAFTHGLHAVAGISAAIAIGVAVMDAILLRCIGADTGP